MTKGTKRLTLICVIVLALGIVIGGAGLLMGGMQSVSWGAGGPKIFDENDASQMIVIDERYDGFKNIEINIGYLDKIIIKEGTTFSVKGQVRESHGGLIAELDGGTLTVKNKSTGLILGGFSIGPFFNTEKTENRLEVTYPAGTKLSSLNLNTDLSDVEITGLAADKAVIDNDSGDMKISGITGTKLTINNDLGDTLLENVTEGRIEIDNASGSLTLKDITGGTLFIDNDLGEVKAENIDVESADCNNANGDLTYLNFRSGGLKLDNDLGETKISGVLEGISTIENDNGDLKLDLNQPENALSYDIDSDLGDTKVNGKAYGGSAKNSISDARNVLKINSRLGDVTLNFSN
jgi:DUF4097 and DUF4098 domain-containing protein YvlB